MQSGEFDPEKIAGDVAKYFFSSLTPEPTEPTPLNELASAELAQILDSKQVEPEYTDLPLEEIQARELAKHTYNQILNHMKPGKENQHPSVIPIPEPPFLQGQGPFYVLDQTRNTSLPTGEYAKSDLSFVYAEGAQTMHVILSEKIYPQTNRRGKTPPTVTTNITHLNLSPKGIHEAAISTNHEPSVQLVTQSLISDSAKVISTLRKIRASLGNAQQAA